MISVEKLIETFDLQRARMSGDNLMASCPLGTHVDKHPSFGINVFSQKWNCYTCGIGGNSLRSLAYKIGIQLPFDMLLQSIKLSNETEVKIDNEELKKFLKIIEYPYRYLINRGVSAKVCKENLIGGTEDNGVVIPILDINSVIKAFVIRNEKWAGRYGFYPENVKRTDLLLGMRKQMTECYLVEGVVDKLKLESWGYDSVATLGNALFEDQAKQLLINCDKIILVPDMDNGGKNWYKDVRKLLKGKIPVFGIRNSKTKDVGDKNYYQEDFEEDKKKIQFLF